MIGEYEREGVIDYITLSARILFGGKYALSYDQIKRGGFYNNLGETQYDASGYIDGLEVVRNDFREVIKSFCSSKNVLYIADPPYTTTYYGHYAGNTWNERDDADLIRALHGSRYIFFTSNKTDIIEHIDMPGSRANKSPILYASNIITRERIINYQAKYSDILITNL